MNDNTNPQKRHHCTPLKLELESKIDRNGKKIYFQHVKAPFVIDFSKGVSLFVFTSEEGHEEIQFKVYEEKPANYRERDDGHSNRDGDNPRRRNFDDSNDFGEPQ